MQFREWLLFESTAKKLAIFDYDNTLANTPEPPEDWEAEPYVAPDGKVRKSKDWWTHPDSLSDYKLNDFILKKFQKARSDPNTRAVLLTGRQGMRTAHLIRDKLRSHDLYGKRMISPAYKKALDRHNQWPNGPHPAEDDESAHEEYYKGDMAKEPDYPKTKKGQPDQDAFAHKRYVIERKLMNQNVESIEFWDDREKHFPLFVNLFKRMLKEWPNLHQVTVHKVTPQGIETTPLGKEQ